MVRRMECEKKDCIYQPMNVNCVNCGSKHINYQPELARQVPDGEIQAAIGTLDHLNRRYRGEAVGASMDYRDVQTSIDLAIAALRAYRPVDGSTSDGHHTFDELYHHRAVLFSAVCYAYKDKAWRSKKHHDGTMFGDDWFIVGVETPAGQYSYHYRISKCWCLFNFCQTDDFAPEWDGHQPNDVDRLLSLKQYRKPEKPDCQSAEWAGGKCCGYGKSETDDEPIDYCKICPKQASYGEETDAEDVQQHRKPEPCAIVMRHKNAEGGYRYVECPDCHKQIEAQHPIEIDLPYCGGCGHAVWDGGAKFCSECGRALQEDNNG